MLGQRPGSSAHQRLERKVLHPEPSEEAGSFISGSQPPELSSSKSPSFQFVTAALRKPTILIMGEVLSPLPGWTVPPNGRVLLLSQPLPQTSSEEWRGVPVPATTCPQPQDSAPEMRKPRSVHCRPLWHSPPEGGCPPILAPTHCSDHAWPTRHTHDHMHLWVVCLLPVTCTRPQTSHRRGIRVPTCA